MKEVILIDKINIVTFLVSIFFHNKKIIIFTKTNTAQERFFLSFFLLIKKKFKFDLINYDDNPSFYREIHKSAFDMTVKNVDKLYDDEIMSYIFRSSLYNSLFKISEIEVFFGQRYNIKYIFINYINPLKKLEYINSFQNKIKYYRWFNLRLNDLPESSLDRMSLDKVLINKIKWVVPLFKINLLIRPYEEISANILYCSDRSYTRNKVNNIFIKFDKEADIFYNINKQKIYFKNEERCFHSLEFNLIYKYLAYIFNNIKKYRNILKKYEILNLYEQVYIFKNIFFIENFIKNNNIKILFSVNETIINTILNSIASRHGTTISVSASWSLASFPLFCPGFNKMSDVNFTWGRHQVETYIKSLDNSSNYVITGYLGDFAINYFREASCKYSFDYIVLYDNVFYDDIFITQQQVYDLTHETLLFCVKNNLKLIIKTKYEKTFKDYKSLNKLSKKFQDIIMFEYGRADLTPVFNAKIAIGISNSSLINIASCWGVPSILYDQFDMVNERSTSNNCFLVKNLSNLRLKLSLLYSGEHEYSIDRSSEIDPFVDGNALDRIYEYIESLQVIGGAKQERITRANLDYSDKYGKDKVILNTRRN
jgi:hypothetical protein